MRRRGQPEADPGSRRALKSGSKGGMWRQQDLGGQCQAVTNPLLFLNAKQATDDAISCEEQILALNGK